MFKRSATIVSIGMLLTACGQQQPPEPQASAAAAAPAAAAAAPAGLPRQPSAPGAELYFISPTDGEVVRNPVRIVFGLKGAGVAPAGVDHPNTGHHHLLIDAELPPLDLPIPADDNHVHFGLGQTEATVTLPVGERRLQLVLGDHLHIPHDPPLISAPITIRVEP